VGWKNKGGWVTVFMHVKRGGLSKSHASLRGGAWNIFDNPPDASKTGKCINRKKHKS